MNNTTKINKKAQETKSWANFFKVFYGLRFNTNRNNLTLVGFIYWCVKYFPMLSNCYFIVPPFCI